MTDDDNRIIGKMRHSLDEERRREEEVFESGEERVNYGKESDEEDAGKIEGLNIREGSGKKEDPARESDARATEYKVDKL